MDIPSGMLWRAIAKDKVIPSTLLFVVDRNVVIPSGILWSTNTIIDIIPSLYRLLSTILFSTVLSTYMDKIIPNTIKINVTKKPGKIKK